MLQEDKRGYIKFQQVLGLSEIKQVLPVMPIFVGGVSALLTAQDAMPEIPILDGIPCLYRVGSCSHCY